MDGSSRDEPSESAVPNVILQFIGRNKLRHCRSFIDISWRMRKLRSTNRNLTMNLSKEQKTVIKSLVLFVIISIVVDTVMSLCKGSFNLSDTLLYSLFIILGGIGLAVFYILGMKTPKK